MVTARQAFGGLLAFAGIAIIINAVKDQLLVIGAGQALGVPSFITNIFTPDVSMAQQTDIGIGIVALIIGLILIASGGNKR